MRYLALSACVLLIVAPTGIGQEADKEQRQLSAEKAEASEQDAESGTESALKPATAGQEEQPSAGSAGVEPGLAPDFHQPSGEAGARVAVPSVDAAFDGSMAPFSRFIAHRGAGARVLTFPNVLAPPGPDVKHEYGPWALRARLALEEHYTDNVFLTPGSEQSEWTSVITPQLGVDWTHPSFGLALDYGGQFFRPHRFRENQREDHQIGFHARWKVRNSLSAGFENVYGWRTIAADFEGDNYTRFRDNSTGVGLTYEPWPDWKVDLGYDRYQACFRDIASDNVTVNGFGTGVSRRIFPAVWGQAKFRYANVENHDVGGLNTDNDECTASLGLRLDPMAPFSGTLQMGYTEKDYDSSAISDADTLYLHGGITYSPRERTQVFWSLRRSIQETSVSALNQPRAGAANYVRTSTSLGARFDVTDRWGFGVLGFYATDDYSGAAGREDDLYGGSASLFFEFNSASRAALRYQYQRNDSDGEANDFMENFVNLSLQLSF